MSIFGATTPQLQDQIAQFHNDYHGLFFSTMRLQMATLVRYTFKHLILAVANQSDGPDGGLLSPRSCLTRSPHHRPDSISN